MRLSLKRKLGYLHVRGNRVLEVTHDHQVKVGTENALEAARDLPPGTKWVTARIGDYAVEMVAVKTGNVIGYAYISGEPIRLNLYRDKAPDHWFKEARAMRFVLDSELFMREVIHKQDGDRFAAGVIMANHFAGADILTFRTRGDDVVAAQTAWQSIGTCLKYVPTEWNDDQEKRAAARMPHVIGVVEYRSPKYGIVVCHSQPERHAAPDPCSTFVTEMLSEMDLPVFDPWPEILGREDYFPKAADLASGRPS